MSAFAYLGPASTAEAIAALAAHGDAAHLLAGGTAVVPLLKQGLIQPSIVIGLGGLDALRAVAIDGDTLEVGALTSLRDVERHPLVRAHAPALAAAVARVATIRIRNQATIGGNLVHADPAQDPPPMLLAHDASVVLASERGTRTVELADFFVDVFETAIEPDEILTAIRVPRPATAARFAYEKFLPRTVDDYATVSVAVRLDLDADGAVADARIALGNAGPIPFRAVEAEAILRGTTPSSGAFEGAAAAAADASDPVDDVRGSRTYKQAMVRLWTARALARAIGAGPR
ncbi:MAG TPA: FAD binding domain-containing protein [Candidatus Saccharimonadales bacterium]|nr:FAD binding domain-containing protein [Candidatus Saccharimonadales bacterium]